ncbi:MAG: PAS domain-containing protein [Rhodoferax sp.]|nr:PAS domain-containing protein [Rhodoferax sp.]
MSIDIFRSFLVGNKSFWRTLWTCLTYPKFFQSRINGEVAKPSGPEFFQLNYTLVDQKVMAARIRVFAERSFEGALTAPLGTLLLAWVGGSVVGWKPAVAWIATFCFIEFLIGRSAFLCRRDTPQKLDILTQGRRLIFLSFLVGLAWGSSVFVFWVEGQIQTYLVILTVLVGVSAVSVSIMSPFLMATVLFYSGLLLPPLIHALLFSDPIGLKIAIGLGILCFLMLQHGSVVGLQLVRNLESSVRSEMLAERLRLALDAARQDWFDLNPRTGQMVASSTYARPHGMLSDDATYGFQDWLAAIHPDDRATTQSAFSGALKISGAVESEFRIRAPNDGYVLNGHKRDIGSMHKTPNGLENFQVYQQRNL